MEGDSLVSPTTVDANQVWGLIKKEFGWGEKFRKELDNCPAANEAFSRLFNAGCDPVELLARLDFCCRVDAAKKDATCGRQTGEDIESFGEKLLKTAKELQKFEASGNKGGKVKASQLPEFQGLSARLQAYSDCLIGEGEELKQGLSARDVPRFVTVRLASYVEGCTGESYFSEIARLMEAHYSMQGIHKDISLRSVERKVKRFGKEHPYAYSHMRGMARRQHAELTGEWPKFREERDPDERDRLDAHL